MARPAPSAITRIDDDSFTEKCHRVSSLSAALAATQNWLILKREYIETKPCDPGIVGSQWNNGAKKAPPFWGLAKRRDWGRAVRRRLSRTRRTRPPA